MRFMGKLKLQPACKGKYFYGTFPESSLMALAGYISYFAAIVREGEGITAVFSEEAAGPLRLYSQKDFQGPFALIRLETATGLLATGITAAASSALAKEKIPANFIAGFYHDCVLVPEVSKEKALSILANL